MITWFYMCKIYNSRNSYRTGCS